MTRKAGACISAPGLTVMVGRSATLQLMMLRQIDRFPDDQQGRRLHLRSGLDSDGGQERHPAVDDAQASGGRVRQLRRFSKHQPPQAQLGIAGDVYGVDRVIEVQCRSRLRRITCGKQAVRE
jgi:hypothetical protein